MAPAPSKPPASPPKAAPRLRICAPTRSQVTLTLTLTLTLILNLTGNPNPNPTPHRYAIYWAKQRSEVLWVASYVSADYQQELKRSALPNDYATASKETVEHGDRDVLTVLVRVRVRVSLSLSLSLTFAICVSP